MFWNEPAEHFSRLGYCLVLFKRLGLSDRISNGSGRYVHHFYSCWSMRSVKGLSPAETSVIDNVYFNFHFNFTICFGIRLQFNISSNRSKLTRKHYASFTKCKSYRHKTSYKRKAHKNLCKEVGKDSRKETGATPEDERVLAEQALREEYSSRGYDMSSKWTSTTRLEKLYSEAHSSANISAKHSKADLQRTTNLNTP